MVLSAGLDRRAHRDRAWPVESSVGVAHATAQSYRPMGRDGAHRGRERVSGPPALANASRLAEPPAIMIVMGTPDAQYMESRSLHSYGHSSQFPHARPAGISHLSHWIPSYAMPRSHTSRQWPNRLLPSPARGDGRSAVVIPQLGCCGRPQQLGQRNLLYRGPDCSLPLVSYSGTTLFGYKGPSEQSCIRCNLSSSICSSARPIQAEIVLDLIRLDDRDNPGNHGTHRKKCSKAEETTDAFRNLCGNADTPGQTAR